ncbi:MAG: type II toxin-antitoxin system RelE/ParE family toxin [Chloroflexi bacterium]|nr:type II toxin-antitoxin system RelE/ParE family toxin [Chloroflexota bacterium]
MSYQVQIVPSAEKEMNKLPEEAHARISSKILSLENQPRPVGVKKLSGGKEEYRLRIGDYRVLYTVDDKGQVEQVFAVGHRKDTCR